MRKAISILLLLGFIPQSIPAATIYLRDRTRIENVKIIEERVGMFYIQKAGENYSVLYTQDTINKADIFCIIDDAGIVRYPVSLAATMPVDSLTAKEFQEALLRQQLEALNEQNSNLRDIGTIAILSTLVAVSTSIAIWSIYGLMK